MIANWRSVVAPPGITPEQRKTLSDAVEKMVKSDAWKDILKQKGWDDAYLGGDAFAEFLKKENGTCHRRAEDRSAWSSHDAGHGASRRSAPRRVDRAGIVIAASLAGLAAVLVWDAQRPAIHRDLRDGAGGHAGRDRRRPRAARDRQFHRRAGAATCRRAKAPIPMPVVLILGGPCAADRHHRLRRRLHPGNRRRCSSRPRRHSGAAPSWSISPSASCSSTLVYLAFDELLTLSLPAGPLERLL